MPNFGYETIEELSINCTNSAIWGTGPVYSPASDGVLDSMSVYSKAASGTINIRMGLFDDSDDSLVGTTVMSGDIDTTYGWNQVNADGVVNVYAATSYRLAVHQSANHYVRRRESGGPLEVYDFHTWPNAWPDPASFNDNNANEFCIYATYTPSAEYVDMAGSISAQSSVSGAVKVVREIAATVTAQSGAAAALKVLRSLAGLVQGQSGLTATLKVHRDLAGTISAQSGLSGALEISGVVDLAGSIQAQSAMAASMKVNRSLAGIVQAQSTVVGALEVEEESAGVASYGSLTRHFKTA